MSVFLRRYRNDILLIAALLLLSSLIFAVRTCREDTGKYAVVEINGEVVDVFSLSEKTDKTYRLTEDPTGTGEDGKSPEGSEGSASWNRISIEDGWVSVSAASCPDQICVHHKPVSKTGETIVCLPHKFVVTITDGTGTEQERTDRTGTKQERTDRTGTEHERTDRTGMKQERTEWIVTDRLSYNREKQNSGKGVLP